MMTLVVLVLLLVLQLIRSNSSNNNINVLDVSKEKAVVVAMIVRHDEPLLSSTLPIWLSVTKYFVFILDSSYNQSPSSPSSSSSSSSHDILTSFIKNNKNINSIIVQKPFTTYDTFREIALNTSIMTYPQASHIWLANSDWLPIISTININDIDNHNDIYEFKKTNRYDNTTVELCWIVRNKLGLRMKYSFNEIIDPVSIHSTGIVSKKSLAWQVDELEKYYRYYYDYYY